MGLSGSSQKQNTTNTGTSSSNTQNTFDRLPGASSPDIDTLRNQQFEVDPGLASQYGRQRQDLQKSFAQPLGGFLSPQVRDAQMRSGMERLGRDEAQALRGGQFDKNKLDYARNATVAEMTAPPLVQTSSSSTGTNAGNTTGTVTQNPSALSTGLKIGSALTSL